MSVQEGKAGAETAAARDGAVVVGRDITRRFGQGEAAVDALQGVSVELARGELTAIMGPSGSGKSTLMHILAGLDSPTSGSVTIDGVELAGLSDRELTLLRREKIGFVFQFFNLLPMLTAEENMTLPLDIGGATVDPEWLASIERAFRLEDRTRHRPAELSGGEQQRVAVARSLLSKPAVVFADEPTGNLDSTRSQEVLELMRKSVDDYGQTIIIVTHDARAAAFADRVLFLADGRIVRDRGQGTADEILDEMKALDSA